MLHNFMPFIALFTAAGEDAQVSLAAMVERIKLASDVLCWEGLFQQPIYAYLKRKLRGATLKLQGVASMPSPPASSVKRFTLREGEIYYLSLGETNENEDGLIYFPVRLTRFTQPYAAMQCMQLEVEFLDANGSVCDVKILILNIKALYMNMFVPKAEFEANPLGAVMFSLRAPLLSDHSDAIPTDFSSYASDMRLILSHVASLCAHFRVHPNALPDPIKQSPFSVSKGGTTLRFTHIDHGASFKPFFSPKTAGCSAEQLSSLLDTPALRETNRCFFIHLGVALGVHPLAMQAIFRAHSDLLLKRLHLALSQKTHEDDQRFDVLNMFEASLKSVLQHNDMVDAPILGIVWPQEFQVLILTHARAALLISRQELQNVRILIFTVGRNGPQPSTCYLFSPRDSTDDSDEFNGTDVILMLQGMHFTILQPLPDSASMSAIDQILDLYPEIAETRPLHLQPGEAGDIVREVGRVQSVAELHCAHCTVAAPPPAQQPAPDTALESYD